MAKWKVRWLEKREGYVYARDEDDVQSCDTPEEDESEFIEQVDGFEILELVDERMRSPMICTKRRRRWRRICDEGSNCVGQRQGT